MLHAFPRVYEYEKNLLHFMHVKQIRIYERETTPCRTPSTMKKTHTQQQKANPFEQTKKNLKAKEKKEYEKKALKAPECGAEEETRKKLGIYPFF